MLPGTAGPRPGAAGVVRHPFSSLGVWTGVAHQGQFLRGGARQREVARRTLRSTAARRSPVSTEQVNAVLLLLEQEDSLPADIMAAAIVLGFYGFLRADEIRHVEWQAMRLNADFAEIFIIDSKTDQYAEGRWVVVAASASGLASVACPVRVLRRLLERGEYAVRDADASDALLVRAVSATPKRAQPHCLRGPRQGLSYSALLDKCRAAFARIGVDGAAFAMHVLRISGATEAARAEVPDRLRLTQGGWRSEQTLRRYTREGVPAQAKVNSAMLGLLESGKEPAFE